MHFVRDVFDTVTAIFAPVGILTLTALAIEIGVALFVTCTFAATKLMGATTGNVVTTEVGIVVDGDGATVGVGVALIPSVGFDDAIHLTPA